MEAYSSNGPAPGAPAPKLSAREWQMFGLVAEGLNNRQVAKRLDTSTAAIISSLRAIFQKVGTSSRLEIVRLSLGDTNWAQTLNAPKREELTKREWQAVDLTLHGLKNKEIAEEMGIGEQAVKNLLRLVFEKLNISNRQSLIILFGQAQPETAFALNGASASSASSSAENAPVEERKDQAQSPPEPTPLSSRERQVLELALKGLKNREIGNELNIELQTVKNHLDKIFKKLRVSNRAQLEFIFTGESKALNGLLRNIFTLAAQNSEHDDALDITKVLNPIIKERILEAALAELYEILEFPGDPAWDGLKTHIAFARAQVVSNRERHGLPPLQTANEQPA